MCRSVRIRCSVAVNCRNCAWGTRSAKTSGLLSRLRRAFHKTAELTFRALQQDAVVEQVVGDVRREHDLGERDDLRAEFGRSLQPLVAELGVYNTVAVCHRGRILGVVPKTFIPTYGVDFEGRWFHSGPADGQSE